MASSESLLNGRANGVEHRLVTSIGILQHGAAAIIDISVPVSMPQAGHRNQRKAPAVERMPRICDRDLFRPSIPRPSQGIKKWDRKSFGVAEQTVRNNSADIEQMMPVTSRARQARDISMPRMMPNVVQSDLRRPGRWKP